MGLTGEIIDRVEALAPQRAAWDDLAREAARPYSLSAWALAWWAEARPESAQLRVVVVHDGSRLVGIAPLWLARGELAVLGGDVSSPAEPLAERGREAEVATLVARMLRAVRPIPAVLRLALQGEAPNWSALLSENWGTGGRPWQHASTPVAAPFLEPGADGFEAWLASRGRSLRQGVRRRRRRLEEAGGRVRLSTPETVGQDLDSLFRLHRSRWRERGRSSVTPPVERMIAVAAAEMVGDGSLRVVCVEVGDAVASAQVFVAAGGHVAYWNGGFDEAHAALSPSILGLEGALEDLCARGERRLDLGPGAQEYKSRLADREEMFTTHLLVPMGARYLQSRARLAPYQARELARSRLSKESRERLRRLLRR